LAEVAEPLVNLNPDDIVSFGIGWPNERVGHFDLCGPAGPTNRHWAANPQATTTG
jgi:hypothetical protein